ncbi:MAG: hypothetical protein HN410_05135 [Prolixibacteraceae bacterium]|nr:hypothetical protein [Prolixibacteraceae bacterium]
MIKKRKHIKLLIQMVVFSLGLVFQVSGQEPKIIEGAVSYISGQSIYVKFESTQGIENGDTLFMLKNEILTPALIVEHRSSISCLCKAVGENTFKVADQIVGKQKGAKNREVTKTQTEEQVEQDVNEQALVSLEKGTEKPSAAQNVAGRISLSSYSNFSNSTGDDVHRFRYTVSMKALNISDSKLSAETYISFSHKLNQWDLVQEDLSNALKIYSLALKYDFNESATLWAGRKINPKIANVGAVDGLQFQKQFNNFFAGAVVGSRPDFQNYGYNIDLLEYGAYVGQSQKVENGFVQTSLAFFEQRNSSNIDRRFTYFQHSNSFIKNVNIFSSFELDLYKLENGVAQNTVSLTSLYFSIRYRVSRRLSLFASFDTRKNVIYYETFKNYADEVLQLASRQGLRFRVNYRPINYLNIGINAGTRSRKEDPRPTKTLNSNVTYTRLPWINASLALSSNLMQTSYLDGQVYGARLSKDIVPGKLYSQFHYRFVNFNYVSSASNLKQNIGEVNFSYQFNKKLYLSVNLEATFQENENYNRVYLNLRRKF